VFTGLAASVDGAFVLSAMIGSPLSSLWIPGCAGMTRDKAGRQ
jgi:hypothetical protein